MVFSDGLPPRSPRPQHYEPRHGDLLGSLTRQDLDELRKACASSIGPVEPRNTCAPLVTEFFPQGTQFIFDDSELGLGERCGGAGK